MMKKSVLHLTASFKWVLCALLILIIGSSFRFYSLTSRPLHTDEAVHGIKFGQLLDGEPYLYDPFDYHGPTLNYLTFIPAWIRAQTDIQSVDEWTLRSVPVVFGILMIIIPLIFRSLLHIRIGMVIAFITAVSPAFVFYSRYYIQEVLFVVFTFLFVLFGFKYFHSGIVHTPDASTGLSMTSPPMKRIYAIVSGLTLGLMIATKETWIITLFACIGAGLSVCFLSQIKDKENIFKRSSIFNLDLLLFFSSVLVVFVLCFSSFFQHLKGIIDALSPLVLYLKRGGGESVHVYPWYYYFKLLLFPGIKWMGISGEGIIFLLGLLGIVLIIKKAFSKSDDYFNYVGSSELFLFIAIYSIIMMMIYSIIPYKTPWNLLGFYHGMIICAGVGIVLITRMIRSKWLMILWFFFLVETSFHVIGQSIHYTSTYEDNPKNPYVYSHPEKKIYQLIDDVHDVVMSHPDTTAMHINVIYPNADYWPLPWYFRDLLKVGWWNDVDLKSPAAPMVLAHQSFEEKLIQKWYEIPPPGQKHMYVLLRETPYELRPNVYIDIYLRKDLWDRYQQDQITEDELPL